MHRWAILTIAVGALAAAPAQASVTAVGRLHVPGQKASSEPARLAVALPGAWVQDRGTLEGTPVLGHFHVTTTVGAGAQCTVTVGIGGVTVPEADAPTLKHGTLTIHNDAGFLLPRMTVARHGTAARLRWYAGPVFATAVADRAGPTIDGIAVLAAPSWSSPAPRVLAVARLTFGARIEKWIPATSGGVAPVAPTAAETSACFQPAAQQMPALLRTTLRSVRIVRRIARHAGFVAPSSLTTPPAPRSDATTARRR
jgi:hypothetical protein